MKKKSFYWFAMMMAVVLCAGFTSCGDDDDENEGGSGNSSALIGTWKEVAWEEYDANGKLIDSDEYEEDDVFVFFAEGGWGGSYELGSSHIDEFKYTVSGNTLTLLDGKEKETLEIVTLTNSKLVVKELYGKDGWGISTLKKVSDSVLDYLK